jgi:hypothetical protein
MCGTVVIIAIYLAYAFQTLCLESSVQVLFKVIRRCSTLNIMALSPTAGRLTLLLRIREVSGSYLDPETVYPD